MDHRIPAALGVVTARVVAFVLAILRYAVFADRGRVVAEW
jgi:hypothetical protein